MFLAKGLLSQDSSHDRSQCTQSKRDQIIPILFNDEPYLPPPNLPLVLALAARSAGGAAGGGVNSMQHQIKSVLDGIESLCEVTTG